MKVQIKVTVDVDPAEWAAEYGCESSEVRQDVRTYFESLIADAPAITDSRSDGPNLVTANLLSVTLDPRFARELAQAGRKTEEWREKRDDLIREAHAAGASLREIAAAVGLSNPGVLRVVRR